MQQGTAQQKDTLPRQITVNLGEDGIQPYPATLDYFAPNVDLSTGTLNLRARLDNPKGLTEKRTLCQHHLAIQAKNRRQY